MNKTSPKVTASSTTALVTALVITLLYAKIPALQAWNDYVQTVVAALVTGVAAWLAGWLVRAVDWATRYVQDHNARSAPFVEGTPRS